MEEILSQISSNKLRSRIQRANVRKYIMFFDYNNQLMAFDGTTSQFYQIESSKNSGFLTSCNMPSLESPYIVKAVKVTTLSGKPLKPSFHAVDRIIERSGVIKCRSKAEQYIMNAIKIAQIEKSYYLSADGITAYVYKQFVFLVKDGCVVTSIRKNKLHSIAILAYWELRLPLPVAFTSKSTKVYVLG